MATATASRIGVSRHIGPQRFASLEAALISGKVPNSQPMSQGPELPEFEGRRGTEWVKSILSYLEFRAGTSWRSVSERFHSDRIDYVAAIHTVNAAFNKLNPKPCDCAICAERMAEHKKQQRREARLWKKYMA